ncbi:MAG: A24 family peptidase [Eubacteriales bacterium]|nr:A24 family peptidase [Eubacteriales bacterium]
MPIGTVVFCVFLAGTAFMDLKERRVRNKWLLMAALSGLFIRGTAFVWAASVFLIPGFLLYYFRMAGAGDGKTMAVIGGFLGVDAGLRAVGLGFALGALWGLRHWKGTGALAARFTYFWIYLTQAVRRGAVCAYRGEWGDEEAYRIPLAACMAAGSFLYLAGRWTAGRGGIG